MWNKGECFTVVVDEEMIDDEYVVDRGILVLYAETHWNVYFGESSIIRTLCLFIY